MILSEQNAQVEPLSSGQIDKPNLLENFDTFKSHPWVSAISSRYSRDSVLATHALVRVVRDLEKLNQWYEERNNRVIFTSVQGRVKTQDSFMRKLFESCRDYGRKRGMTQGTIPKLYLDIKDLCGVRFSCPYYDDVQPAIDSLVRPHLATFGYATDLRKDSRYRDKNYLDEGDKKAGYRSYHFFIKVPTPIDIYGNVAMCICEVQARTELQHVWAVKSHDLLYKPDSGWDFSDPHVLEDMRQLSNSLRAADQSLMSIRDRAKGKGNHA